MIKFSCTCGKRYQVEDEYAGRHARCVCGKTLVIPEPATGQVGITSLVTARKAEICNGEDYADVCLQAQFFTEAESRKWNSDPAFQTVLNALNRCDFDKAIVEAEALLPRYGDLHLVYQWIADCHIRRFVPSWIAEHNSSWNDNERRTHLEKATQALSKGLAVAKRKDALCVRMGETAWLSGKLKLGVFW